jgi:hypothetical protein
MEIDLDNQTVQKDEIQLRQLCYLSLFSNSVLWMICSSRLDPILAAAPHPKAVKSLLTKPSVSTIFTTENIGFTRYIECPVQSIKYIMHCLLCTALICLAAFVYD